MIFWFLHSPSLHREHALLNLFVSRYDIEAHVFYRKLHSEADLHELSRTARYSFSVGRGLAFVSLIFDAVMKSRESRRSGSDSLFWFGGWNHWSEIFAIFICQITNSRYVLFTDTVEPKQDFHSFRGLVRLIYLRRIFKRAALIATTGEIGVQYITRSNLIKPNDLGKLVSFHYFVNRRTFEQATVPTPEKTMARERLECICVGWIDSKRKGQDIIIRALACLVEPEKIHVTFAGSGPDVHLLEQLARHLRVEDQVTFVGNCDSEQIINLYRCSQVLLHASPVHEPYGVVVIEAMMSGLVVCASDLTCAALDVLQHGNTGFIHEAGNHRDLASCLESLSSMSPIAFESMSKRSRELSTCWDIEIGSDRLKKIYDSYKKPE